MNEKALNLLIYSLDNQLTPLEQEELDQYLASSEALREEKEALLEMRAGLASLRREANENFADQLIRKIQSGKVEKPVQNFQLAVVKLFPKVAAACVIAMVLTVLGTFYVEGNLSLEAFIGVQDLSPEDAYSLLDY